MEPIEAGHTVLAIDAVGHFHALHSLLKALFSAHSAEVKVGYYFVQSANLFLCYMDSCYVFKVVVHILASVRELQKDFSS